jgi:hypothetical protein
VNDVFVERHWPEALSLDAVLAMAIAGETCMRVHRISWHGSLLSSDGRELLCHFRAPDAESVRIALRQSGSPPGNVWPCSAQDAPGVQGGDLAATNVVVVHGFDTPADFGARQVLEDVDMGCFQLHRVRLLRSYLSNDRLRMVCLYQAPDAESVRIAQRRAGLPADRAWAVQRLAP